jgi:hypothetical protein
MSIGMRTLPRELLYSQLSTNAPPNRLTKNAGTVGQENSLPWAWVHYLYRI